MKVLAVEASTRSDSSTNTTLDQYLENLPSSETKKYRLKDFKLPLFLDRREKRDFITDANVERLLEDMVWADKIVLASPLYWYTVSHLMKNFLDHWTYYLRHPKHALKEIAKDKPFAFIVVGHGEKSNLTEAVFLTLRQSIHFIGAKVEEEIYRSEAQARN